MNSAYFRIYILDLISQRPRTMSELAKEMSLSKRSVKHHLDHLKRNHVIQFRKKKKQRGNPILIHLNPSKDTVSMELVKKAARFVRLMKSLREDLKTYNFKY